jgi:penicillin-binding protein 1C
MRPLTKAVALLALAAGALVAWVGVAGRALPSFETARAAHRPSEALLLDRRGEPLQSLRIDAKVRRLAWVRLDEVSPAAVRAVLAAEDRRFHAHPGVDVLALGAALRDGLAGRGSRGASTLTMQVAGMLDPALNARRGGRSAEQKLAQIGAALALERRWTKTQILEYYLNTAAFRGELAGIGAAARGIFGRAPGALDAHDGLLVAALLPQPNAAPHAVAARACRLGRLAAEPCLALRARAAAVLAAPQAIDAPHALAPHVARRLLAPGRRAVRSTLDAGVQRLALRALQEQLRRLDDRAARDGAALVVDNASGDVLAYIGSGGPASRAPQVDGVRSARQAGSTLKPFLYGLALERRYLTAASVLEDSAFDLATPAGLYVPRNYDEAFRGPVSARLALASSLNVPAVRVLELTGIAAFHTRLRELGFGTLEDDPEHYGYSLALGSAEVTLWDLVNAYRTLANGGLAAPLRLEAVTTVAPVRVLDAGTAFIVADILADRAARGPTFGLDSPLATRSWAAVKTGTSKAMRDNWCLGFSDRYTVGVWVGNFEGDAMSGVSGVTGAAPAWAAIMAALHAATPARPPRAPAGVEARPVRFADAFEPSRPEWFLAGTASEHVARAARVAGTLLITAPADGAVLALDPDIPSRYQRVAFDASAPDPTARWRLNDRIVGDAAAVLAWRPVPGEYKLELVAADGTALDAVSFRVRGGAQTPP